jgi:hypothetical protein
MYGAEPAAVPRLPRGPRQPCENVARIMGFHVDGFAAKLVNRPERL